MPDLFVLTHSEGVSGWQISAGPLEQADVSPAVTRALNGPATTRAVVVRVIRSFRSNLAIVEDQDLTVTK